MTITKLDAASMSCSRWSGGTTTQLAICPPDAVYADRDFLWRLSSARVELPESNFTPLPDYDRILMILEGELYLSHDACAEYLLRPLEQTSFDGASHTFSRGQVTDFNLMMRKGRCTGCIDAKELTCAAPWEDTLPSHVDSALYYCVSGSVRISFDTHEEHLSAGDALMLETCSEQQFRLDGNAVVIRAAMNTMQ